MKTTLTAVAAVCLSMLMGSSARADTRFYQQLVGANLPSSDSCRTAVFNSSDATEIRPANQTANNQTGGSVSVQVASASYTWNAKFANRIKGDLAKPTSRNTTTDEVLDWAACKWGLSSYVLRAMAVLESWWRQGFLGDYTYDNSLCQRIGKTAPCYQSYSMLQIKATMNPGTYPAIAWSTPFAADYMAAYLHACYNGALTWLGNGYKAGDIWGCVGAYNSGSWYDSQAQNYISRVQYRYDNETWDTWEFISNP